MIYSLCWNMLHEQDFVRHLPAADSEAFLRKEAMSPLAEQLARLRRVIGRTNEGKDTLSLPDENVTSTQQKRLHPCAGTEENIGCR